MRLDGSGQNQTTSVSRELCTETRTILLARGDHHDSAVSWSRSLFGIATFLGGFSPSFLSAIQNQLLAQLLPDHDVRMIDGVNHSDQKERHLHIIHRASQRVITVLELLSPSNKSPGQDGLGRYLDKRNEFCRAVVI